MPSEDAMLKRLPAPSETGEKIPPKFAGEEMPGRHPLQTSFRVPARVALLREQEEQARPSNVGVFIGELVKRDVNRKR